jgi:elongator complex protein 2
VTVGGHFGEVMDLQWEPGGQFLFSVSMDQTTRIHAPWVRDNHQEVNEQIHNSFMKVDLHVLR